MADNHIIVAGYAGCGYTKTRPAYQHDYGQVLQLDGFGEMLPNAYEMHFSIGMGKAITRIGSGNTVEIPNVCFEKFGTVTAWLFLHDTESDGETKYVIEIPVRSRAKATDQEPTPAEQSVITEAIAALNAGVTAAEAAQASAEADAESAGESAETAVTKAGEAAASAVAAAESASGAAVDAASAGESAETASAVATIAETAAGTATTQATRATNAATRANTSAGNAAESESAAGVSASTASLMADAAETAAGHASDSMLAARESATAAAGSASAAAGSATTAGAAATAAAGSATAAAGSASDAAGSATTAGTKAGEAAASAAAAAQSAAALAGLIDDTAGEGDTTKVWSADKSDKENKSLLSAINVLEDRINGEKVAVDLDDDPGYYITTNAGSIDINSPYSYYSSYRGYYLFAECQPGDVFRITGTGANNHRPWALCDSTGRITRTCAQNATEDETVIVGANEAYIAYNGDKAYAASVFKGKDTFEAIDDRIDSLEDKDEYIEEEIGETEPLVWTHDREGYYIDTSAASIDLSSPYSYSSSAVCYCSVVSCSPGDVFYATLGYINSNARPVIFLDSNGTILFRENNENISNKRYVIPNGVSYIGFQSGSQFAPSVIVGETRIDKNEADISSLQAQTEELSQSVSDMSELIGKPILLEYAYTSGAYVQTNVSTKNVSEPYNFYGPLVNKCLFTTCQPGDVFTVSLFSPGNNYVPWAFWKANGDRISAAEYNVQYHNEKVVAPSEAAYVSFNSGSGDAYGTVYKGQYVFDKLEDEIKEISSPFEGMSGVAFGTSLTYRAETTGGYLQYLPDLLGMEFDNQGVGSAFWNTWQQDDSNILYNVTHYNGYANKDVCIIEGCPNDVGGNRTLGTYKDTGTDTVCGCLYNMINHVYTQNPEITIFVVLSHFGRNYNGTDSSSAYTNTLGLTQYDYYSECAKLCEFYGIPCVKEYAISSMGQFGEQYLRDNIHCNDLGAKQSAQTIASVMLSIKPKQVN